MNWGSLVDEVINSQVKRDLNLNRSLRDSKLPISSADIFSIDRLLHKIEVDHLYNVTMACELKMASLLINIWADVDPGVNDEPSRFL